MNRSVRAHTDVCHGLDVNRTVRVHTDVCHGLDVNRTVYTHSLNHYYLHAGAKYRCWLRVNGIVAYTIFLALPKVNGVFVYKLYICMYCFVT